jgi:hypothetical protein
MKFTRSKSAGTRIRNVDSHTSQSFVPYSSRFLNNRVPPGGGSLRRQAWSGAYLTVLADAGYDFSHVHETTVVAGGGRKGDLDEEQRHTGDINHLIKGDEYHTAVTEQWGVVSPPASRGSNLKPLITEAIRN